MNPPSSSDSRRLSRAFLGRGWTFPVGVNPATGRIAMSEAEQDIREAIRIILATAPGERLMRPDFGCGIHELVFAPISRATLGLFESRIRESLLKYESRVEVVNLGAPGYFSLDSAVNLATRGLAHEPDAIIVYHGINDAIVRMFQDPTCYASDSPLVGMGLDRGIWQYTGEDMPPSALYRLLALRLGWMDDPTVFTDRLQHTGFCPPEPGTNPLDLLDANPPVYFERNLRSIAGLGQAASARVVLSTFAWDTAAAEAALAADPSLLQAEAMLRAIAEQNALIPQIAEDTGALVVDLAAAMGQGAYFQGDQVHQTAAGARRQAEIYAAALASMIGTDDGS